MYVSIHHLGRNDEHAAVIKCISVSEPEKHHEVRALVTFEQSCPAPRLHLPLNTWRSVSRRFHGHSDLARAFHRQQVYGGRIHHTSSVDIAGGPSTNQQSRLDYKFAR